jgi:hypothetical protein
MPNQTNAPTPLKNILFYGFFTTDLSSTNPSSITSIPSHFASLTKSSTGKLGILTNPYLQYTNLNSDGTIESGFTKIKDYLNNPVNLSFIYRSSNSSNYNNTIIYNNSVLFNVGMFEYGYTDNSSISTYYTYEPTSFLLNLETINMNLEDYIKQNGYINFQTPSSSNISSIAVNSTLELINGNIQIDIGLGNILPNWVGNSYTLYNPFLPNTYNNLVSYGNQNAGGWIIYSSDFPTI